MYDPWLHAGGDVKRNSSVLAYGHKPQHVNPVMQRRHYDPHILIDRGSCVNQICLLMQGGASSEGGGGGEAPAREGAGC